jgi:hypothetical protein
MIGEVGVEVRAVGLAAVYLLVHVVILKSCIVPYKMLDLYITDAR